MAKKVDLEQIRRIAITALFSDDVLMDCLVLKGGNALDLVYGLNSRSSIDLDFAMEQDFQNVEDAKRRIFAALRNRFDAAGYVMFDEKFDVCPDLRGQFDEKPWWGGYRVLFKLIDSEKYRALQSKPEKLRFNALTLGGNKQPFKIDLSKCEYTQGKTEREMDMFTISVYTPGMIAIEKLRAICQQMEEYPHTGNKSARARDFYDIYRVVTKLGINLCEEENKTLIQHVFAVKEVPLSLLGNVHREREYHRTDWLSVQAASKEQLKEFDFYFDFVLNEIEELKVLWME